MLCGAAGLREANRLGASRMKTEGGESAARRRSPGPTFDHLRALGPAVAATPGGAAVQAGGRPPSYYVQPRPDVAALIPERCRRVLEVGCGTGQLGRLLRARGHQVTGIELVPEVADEA